MVSTDTLDGVVNGGETAKCSYVGCGRIGGRNYSAELLHEQ